MKKFRKYSVVDNPDLSIMNCFKKRDVYSALKQLEKKSESIELSWFYKLGRDKEYHIEPMYQDAISNRDILAQMNHISDRWFCCARIRFVLRVLEEM